MLSCAILPLDVCDSVKLFPHVAGPGAIIPGLVGNNAAGLSRIKLLPGILGNTASRRCHPDMLHLQG